MKINPINTQSNTNTNFKAQVIKNPSIDSAYSMIEENASSVLMKNLNYAKDFIDGMRKIMSSKKTEKFNIFVDKRRPNYTYVNINGRRVSGGATENKLYKLKEQYSKMLKHELTEQQFNMVVKN